MMSPLIRASSKQSEAGIVRAQKLDRPGRPCFYLNGHTRQEISRAFAGVENYEEGVGKLVIPPWPNRRSLNFVPAPDCTL